MFELKLDSEKTVSGHNGSGGRGGGEPGHVQPKDPHTALQKPKRTEFLQGTLNSATTLTIFLFSLGES